MKRSLAYILTVITAITVAKADILIIGRNFADEHIGMVSYMIDSTMVIFQHEDSCKAYTRAADIVVFRSDCSDKAIAKAKHALKKNNVIFVVESDTCRADICKLIPIETAIKNAMATRLCDCSEKQISYAAACCWYKSITGKDASECSYRPNGIRDEVIGVLQLCGTEAALHPGILTDIDEHWYLPTIQTQWKGKRIVFLGDSITDKGQLRTMNDIYWHMLEKLLGIEAYVYGISGHQMSDILGQAKTMENELGDNFDAILIFAGTNDYNSSVPLGNWYTYSLRNVNDHGRDTMLMHRDISKDGSTFRGRINMVMDSLKSHFPGKQIVIMTPLHRSWANFGGNNIQPDENFCNRAGLYIDSYAECIREASSVWSIPVIDLFSETGLYPGIASQDIYFRHPEKDNTTGFHDLLHPNTAGHILIAYTVAYRMMTIPCYSNCFPR